MTQNSMHNGKFQHIHHRHNTIEQLISNGLLSINYVKSKDNAVNHLMKDLSRAQVYHLSLEMDVKPIN